jgi:hypothetical protein
MNIKDFNTNTEELFKDCFNLLDRKGADYSGVIDRFENFKKNGERLGLTKYQVWSVYFGKHIDAIFNSIKRDPNNPQVESEPLEERFKDAICYLALAAGMLKEDKDSPEVRRAAAFDVFNSAIADHISKGLPREKPVEVPEDVVL